MDEGEIKVGILTRIRREAGRRPLPLVASEFSLAGTGIRADLAILDGQFFGIEIKSASDSLKRLPSQMRGYAQYFDRTILVVAPKHLRGLRSIDLHGAEVWRQEVLGEWQRHAEGVDRSISGHWLLHLLTMEEERRAERELSKLLDQTPAAVDAAQRREFESAFRRRYANSSERFWTAVRGRQIRASDLALLSRFHDDRERIRLNTAANEAMWSRWQEEISAHAAGK